MIEFRTHFLSLARFLKATAVDVGNNFQIEPPAFVNFDAHAQMSSDAIPKADLLGIMGYSVVEMDKMVTVKCNFGVSTWADPDLLRHMDIMDFVTDQLGPECRIPIYTAVNGVAVEDRWLVRNAELVVEPILNVENRTLQFINLSFLSGYSGQA